MIMNKTVYFQKKFKFWTCKELCSEQPVMMRKATID